MTVSDRTKPARRQYGQMRSGIVQKYRNLRLWMILAHVCECAAMAPPSCFSCWSLDGDGRPLAPAKRVHAKMRLFLVSREAYSAGAGTIATLQPDRGRPAVSFVCVKMRCRSSA
jgi:hypothetical protein